MPETSSAQSAPAKHTPGPWEIYEGGNFVRIGALGYIEDSDRRGYMGGPLSVANVEYHATENHDSNHELAMANARLIAAAPDLLAACKQLYPLVEAYRLGPDSNQAMYDMLTPVLDVARAAIKQAEGGTR